MDDQEYLRRRIPRLQQAGLSSAAARTIAELEANCTAGEILDLRELAGQPAYAGRRLRLGRTAVVLVHTGSGWEIEA